MKNDICDVQKEGRDEKEEEQIGASRLENAKENGKAFCGRNLGPREPEMRLHSV